MNKLSILTKGIIKENPVLVLLLGCCPTLATTTGAINGLGMGVSTLAVLVCSNIVISLLKNIIPDKVRIPCYIVVIAGFVTIVQLLLKAYLPALDAALGLFIPLIVVNCIILGRAESYASKNDAVSSLFDGIGMGLGFSIALTLIGIFREFLGGGAFFGKQIIPEDFHISIFILAPGAFFVLAILTALQNKFKAPSATNGSVPQSNLACGGNCASCAGSACADNHLKLAEKAAEEAARAAAAKKAAAEKALAAKKAAEEAKAKAEAEAAKEPEKTE